MNEIKGVNPRIIHAAKLFKWESLFVFVFSIYRKRTFHNLAYFPTSRICQNRRSTESNMVNSYIYLAETFKPKLKHKAVSRTNHTQNH